MSEDLIVSVSGIRGVVGPALGPLEALRFGAALAAGGLSYTSVAVLLALLGCAVVVHGRSLAQPHGLDVGVAQSGGVQREQARGVELRGMDALFAVEAERARDAGGALEARGVVEGRQRPCRSTGG